MKHSEIRIRFQEPSVTVLEVVTGAHDGAEARIFQTVERLALQPHSPYLVHAGDRLIACAKVTDCDGSPLTPLRGAELIHSLRGVLSVRKGLPDSAWPEVPTEGPELRPAA
jgi:hypothetical protein